MKAHRFVLSATACVALALAAGAQAQTRRIAPGPQPARTANAQQAATFGMPSPAGLTSAFPAGLTAGSGPATGAAVTTTGTGTTATSTPTATAPLAGNVVMQNPNATVPATADASGNVAGGTTVGGTTGAIAGGNGLYATTVLGAGAGTNVPAARQGGSFGPGPYTVVEVARSFLNADANGDGELTRAEATRLTLMPFTFEEMDRNHDGVVTRSEYDDGMR
jgi:hypothetical protein